MNGYGPWTLAAQRDAIQQEYNRPANEITISRDDYDHVLALLRTGSVYINKDLLAENATLHVSMINAIKVLEQYL